MPLPPQPWITNLLAHLCHQAWLLLWVLGMNSASHAWAVSSLHVEPPSQPQKEIWEIDLNTDVNIKRERTRQTPNCELGLLRGKSLLEIFFEDVITI